MSLPTHLTNNASQLPIFCSSNALLFYLDDSSTFSQVLTLYNPYDFAVRYKVLSTATRTYTITEPQGEIKALHSVDIIVRLLDTSSSAIDPSVIQKIRILYFDRRKPQDLLGKRDIPCTVHAYKPSDRSVNDEASNLSTLSSRVRSGTNTSLPPTNIALQETRDPLVLAILTILGAMCAFILVLPTIPESESSFQTRIPSYLHMTSNSKVIASYILGLLTVIFIRR